VDSFQCGFVDDGTNIYLWIKPITESEFLCALGQCFLELACNSFLDNQSAGGGATLTSCTKGGPQGRFGDQFEIGVIQHDDGILSAHFERNLFVQPCSCLSDGTSRRGGASE
jgi:hypothetical protein